MMKKQALLIIVSFCFVFHSCKKDVKPTIPDSGQDYFSFTVGSYVVYNVDSTFYDDFYVPSKVTNTKFQLKEKIQSLYYDNQNRLTARLERYVKYYDSLTPYSQQTWQLKNVWAENRTTTTAEKVEENVRYVRLLFPVTINETWNVNNQNYLDARNITYISIDKPDNIGNIKFDSVLQTEYDDGGTLLTGKEYYTEKYARSAGLIYKNIISVQSQPDPNASTAQLQLFYAIPIMQRITSGFQYTWTVSSFGVE